MEAPPRIELGMEVLQTSALPLGYVAASPSILPSKVGPASLAVGCGALATARLSGRHGARAGGRFRDQRANQERLPRQYGQPPGLDLPPPSLGPLWTRPSRGHAPPRPSRHST